MTRTDDSVGTPSIERKALDLLIQASRTDPKLRAAVLEVEKWISRLIESRNEAWQTVNEIEEDAGLDVHYQADLRHKAETERDGLRQEYDTRCQERDAAERERDHLREALTLIGSGPCQIIYGNRKHGWTCLDEQRLAIEEPDAYGKSLGALFRSGAKRCRVCIARAALGGEY